MTQVKILIAAGGHEVGDTLDTSDGAAAHLIAEGYAEAIEAVKATRSKSVKASPETQPEDVGGASSSEDRVTAG